MLLLLACSIDSELTEKPTPGEDTADTGETIDTAPVDTVDTAPVDTAPTDPCNGLDDDGNGVVDDGAVDEDADGIADCVDNTCTLTQDAAGTVSLNSTCDDTPWTPADDLGDFVVEQIILSDQQYSPPIVGRTTDHDGDGDIDADDTPDIYVIDLYTHNLWRFDDSGAATIVTTGLRIASTTIADVDQDGAPELLVGKWGDGTVCAIHPDGTELWCSDTLFTANAGSPLVKDLDGDGTIEVISNGGIADGATGATEVELCPALVGTQPVLGDIDSDGVDEVVCGKALYRADGTLLWDKNESEEDFAYSTFVDRDLDGVPEILLVNAYEGATLYTPEGEALEANTNGTQNWNAICVADIDGDGDAEVGVPRATAFEVYDLEFHQLWSMPTTDMSSAAGCAAFDFDADGAAEFVYADETTFHVFSGDGTEILRWEDHVSGTATEYATIADIDGDGSSEILVSEANGGSGGLAIIGHATDGWAPSDPIWSDNAGIGGMVLPDGTVNPAQPTAIRGGGRYHVQEAGHWDEAAQTWVVNVDLPDLGVAIEDVCVADCTDGPVLIGVRAQNRGSVATDALVTLYRPDNSGDVEVGSTTVSLAAGTTTPLQFTVDTEGDFGWHVTIARADGKDDCDTADNEDRWEDRVCL